jgi:uncharacterized membrane protein YgcG
VNKEIDRLAAAQEECRIEVANARAYKQLYDTGECPCEDCGRTFGSCQALNIHRARIHPSSAAALEKKLAAQAEARENKALRDAARRHTRTKYRVTRLAVTDNKWVYQLFDSAEEADYVRALHDHVDPKFQCDNKWLDNRQWDTQVPAGYSCSETKDGKEIAHLLPAWMTNLSVTQAMACNVRGPRGGLVRDPSSVFCKSRASHHLNLAMGPGHTCLLVVNEGVYTLFRSFLVVIDANPDIKVKSAKTRDEKLVEMKKFYLACKTQVMSNLSGFNAIMNEYFWDDKSDGAASDGGGSDGGGSDGGGSDGGGSDGGGSDGASDGAADGLVSPPIPNSPDGHSWEGGDY